MTLLVLMTLAVPAIAETRTLSFTGFDDVSVGYGMPVSIGQGETYRIEVSGTAADLEQLEVKQNGSRLQFSMRSGLRQLFSSGRVSIAIILPALRRLTLSGGSRGDVTMQLGSEPFSANLSGGSQLTAKLSSGDINLDASGGSKVNLSGNGGRLNLSGSGGSRYDMKDFAVRSVSADMSGGSAAIVKLNGDLTARLSGGSSVTYYGSAVLQSVQTSGGSKVQKGS
jgi:hypothetical protein